MGVSVTKMNSHELDPIKKSLEAVMRKFDTWGKGHVKGLHKEITTGLEGTPRAPNPPVLYQGEPHLHPNCSQFPTTFRDTVEPSTLPLFSGENSRAFVTWLYAVECSFQNKGFSDEKKCEMVVSCLRDFASLWYSTLTLSREMEGKGKLRSWNELSQHMRLKYLPCSKLRADSVQHGVRLFPGLKPEISDMNDLGVAYSSDELLVVASSEDETLVKHMKHEALARGGSFETTKSAGKGSGLDQGNFKPCSDNEYHKPKCVGSKQLMCPFAKTKSSKVAELESQSSKVTPTLKSTFETILLEKEQAYNSPALLHDQSQGLITYLGKLKRGSWTVTWSTNLYSDFEVNKRGHHLGSIPQLGEEKELSKGKATPTLIYSRKKDLGAELRNATPQLIPFTILVYDPGGAHVIPFHEVVFKLPKA